MGFKTNEHIRNKIFVTVSIYIYLLALQRLRVSSHWQNHHKLMDVCSIHKTCVCFTSVFHYQLSLFFLSRAKVISILLKVERLPVNQTDWSNFAWIFFFSILIFACRWHKGRQVPQISLALKMSSVDFGEETCLHEQLQTKSMDRIPQLSFPSLLL